MPQERVTPWIKYGREFGYPECCVQNFSHLSKHGLSAAIVMDYLYGEDSCKEYVRCPDCRDKHEIKPEFPLHKFAWDEKVANQLLGELRVSIRVVRFLNLLPVTT